MILCALFGLKTKLHHSEWQYSSCRRHQSILHIKAAFASLHLRLSVSAGFLSEQVLQYLHYHLVSTKQVICLLESGGITVCKSLLSVYVCVCKWSLEMCVCVCVWYKEESNHNISVLITESKVAVIEVTLLLHTHPFGLYDFSQNPNVFFSVIWRHEERTWQPTTSETVLDRDLICCKTSRKMMTCTGYCRTAAGSKTPMMATSL